MIILEGVSVQRKIDTRFCSLHNAKNCSDNVDDVWDLHWSRFDARHCLLESFPENDCYSTFTVYVV